MSRSSDDALRADLREHESHAAKCHVCGNWTCGYCGLDDEQGHWHCERCAGTGPLAKAEADLAMARAVLDSSEGQGTVTYESDGRVLRIVLVNDAAWQAWQEAKR